MILPWLDPSLQTPINEILLSLMIFKTSFIEFRAKILLTIASVLVLTEEILDATSESQNI